MSAPIAIQDVKLIKQLSDKLPQSLILQAEPGLDADSVIRLLIDQHPTELFTIKPEQGKASIGVGQIRSTLANLATFAPSRRLIIIRPAELMTVEAQNSLLKGLEEPNDGVHFVLVCDDIDSLLPTIMSRCQLHRLHRTSPTQDKQFVSSLGLDNITARQVMFLSSGRPMLMQQIATDQELFKLYQSTASDAKSIIGSKPYERLRLVTQYSTSRDDAVRLLDILISMLKLQVMQAKTNDHILSLIQKSTSARASLKHNANLRLAMLRLV